MSSIQRATSHVHFPHYFQPVRLISPPHVSVKLPLEITSSTSCCIKMSDLPKKTRFQYFALNTEMRWRALQTGRIYVQQHPHDAHLSVAELRDMIGQRSEAFSSRVQHFTCSLRGTRSYWYRQRSRLISMVDTLGLPTIFFTHSAADLLWPNLARLMSPSNPDSSASHRQALAEKLCHCWLFLHKGIHCFIEKFYVGILGATDYWLRFEWQHRGSPHVHGLAWLPNAPWHSAHPWITRVQLSKVLYPTLMDLSHNVNNGSRSE